MTKYQWAGWFDGSDACEPPEPGKWWISIEDEDFNEYAIIVHRSTDDPNVNKNTAVDRKERHAQLIVDALNAGVSHEEVLSP
jgi:hypothetical protein